MRQLLLRLSSEGKTLIVTSHILPELARICNAVAIITGGKLQAFGALDDVMSRLCPQRSYEVQLPSSEQLSRASEVLRGILQTSEPVTISQAECVLRFPTARTEVELAGVLAQLVTSGIVVSQFREVTSDLEDAFLSVADGTNPANGSRNANVA